MKKLILGTVGAKAIRSMRKECGPEYSAQLSAAFAVAIAEQYRYRRLYKRVSTRP